MNNKQKFQQKIASLFVPVTTGKQVHKKISKFYLHKENNHYHFFFDATNKQHVHLKNSLKGHVNMLKEAKWKEFSDRLEVWFT